MKNFIMNQYNQIDWSKYLRPPPFGFNHKQWAGISILIGFITFNLVLFYDDYRVDKYNKKLKNYIQSLNCKYQTKLDKKTDKKTDEKTDEIMKKEENKKED